jgi:multisubunit Na+/H+ antiporter MnhE subunit
MLHAAAMLIGLFVLGLLAIGHVDSESLIAVGIASAACVLLSARLRLIGPGAFSSVPQHIALSLGQAGAAARGALATIRAALAADVTLKPALVRVKSRTQSDAAQAAFAGLISAAPGMLVVETDADGVLVHVNNEDGVDAAELGAIESRVIAALDAGQRS